MKVIEARNVHQALAMGIAHLNLVGIERDSRNGPVLISPNPVTTVYDRPLERVVFWPQRDANPFFHLYEALWMLAGRQDIAPLARYAKNMGNYSDDGVVQRGAYGYRWRNWFGKTDIEGDPLDERLDQLAIIARRLRENPDDRRCVLQMWDAPLDLDKNVKDVPCNTIATFQRDHNGRLDLTIFCRSNDIVWGAYGANAVHFGFLLEYMALWIGCPVGKLYQVSVNWHGYLDTFKKVRGIIDYLDSGYARPWVLANEDPYHDESVRWLPLYEPFPDQTGDDVIFLVDNMITALLHEADTDFQEPVGDGAYTTLLGGEVMPNEFFLEARAVLQAHAIYKAGGPGRFIDSLKLLDRSNTDWTTAAREWILRRYAKEQEEKNSAR